LRGYCGGRRWAQAYANMDVLVFPSHTDTFGNVVLEALASGVPALVTPDGGPKFIVRDGETGFVTEDDHFAGAVAELVGDRARLEEMRLKARGYALGCSWDAVFDRVCMWGMRRRWAWKLMSCRTGLLRGGRPLRGVCTGLGGVIFFGPPVGRGENDDSDQREGTCFLCCRDRLKRRANARSPRRRPVRQDHFSEAECANVGGVGWERHGFEVHGAHAVVSAEEGAEEAAAQMEFHRVGFDGEVLRLTGEVAEDDQDRVGGGDVFGLRIMMRTFWPSRLMVRYSPELMVALL